MDLLSMECIAASYVCKYISLRMMSVVEGGEAKVCVISAIGHTMNVGPMTKWRCTRDLQRKPAREWFWFSFPVSSFQFQFYSHFLAPLARDKASKS